MELPCLIYLWQTDRSNTDRQTNRRRICLAAKTLTLRTGKKWLYQFEFFNDKNISFHAAIVPRRTCKIQIYKEYISYIEYRKGALTSWRKKEVRKCGDSALCPSLYFPALSAFSFVLSLFLWLSVYISTPWLGSFLNKSKKNVHVKKTYRCEPCLSFCVRQSKRKGTGMISKGRGRFKGFFEYNILQYRSRHFFVWYRLNS